MNHPNFINGNFDTHFVANHYTPEMLNQKITDEEYDILTQFTGHYFSSKQPSNQINETSESIAPASNNWRENRLKRR